MDEGTPPETGQERLEKSLDARSSFFQFGYYLQALGSIGQTPGMSTARDRASDAGKLLDRLHEAASRCSALEFLCPGIADVLRLLTEKAGGGDLPADFHQFLGRCAKRWFGMVRELSRKSNSLAVDIAFNLELAGQQDLSADLYESLLCFESGAFRASRQMSRRALEKALLEAGAPETDSLERQLAWAKGTGLITSSDLRSAIANHKDAKDPKDEDASSAEWALDSTLRLAKKLLRAEIEEGLRRASGVFGKPVGPVR